MKKARYTKPMVVGARASTPAEDRPGARPAGVASRRPFTSLTQPWMRTVTLLLVLVLTAAVFSPCLDNGFTSWDDDVYVTDNPLVARGFPGGVPAIFTTFVSGNYHPLVVLSHAVEYRLFRPGSASLPRRQPRAAPAQHRAGVPSAAPGPRRRFAGRGGRRAVLRGAPAAVDAVAWVADRKDLSARRSSSVPRRVPAPAPAARPRALRTGPPALPARPALQGDRRRLPAGAAALRLALPEAGREGVHGEDSAFRSLRPVRRDRRRCRGSPTRGCSRKGVSGPARPCSSAPTAWSATTWCGSGCRGRRRSRSTRSSKPVPARSPSAWLG